MDFAKLKKYPIINYLNYKGYKPQFKSSDSYSYSAKWRGGDNPRNFNVSISKNIWYDYKLGKGGNIIDLVMLLEKKPLLKAVNSLQKIISLNPNFTITESKVPTLKKNSKKEYNIIIKQIGPIKRIPLINYLNQRCIYLEIANTYCKEIYFLHKGKNYYGIGFKNNSNQWVIRNKYFKGCVESNFTYYERKSKDKLVIFEGFFDYLSFIELWGDMNCSYLILNSVVNLKKTSVSEIITIYKSVFLFLDNDDTGKYFTNKLSKKYPNIIDKSHIYKNFKDLNDYLIALFHEK